MMGAAYQRQMQRRSMARSCGAILDGSTARNGWARFVNLADAQLCVELLTQDDESITTVVYNQDGFRWAIDWSDNPRYHNGNVVR